MGAFPNPNNNYLFSRCEAGKKKCEESKIMGVLIICILFITQILSHAFSFKNKQYPRDELESSPLSVDVMWAFTYPCVSRR